MAWHIYMFPTLLLCLSLRVLGLVGRTRVTVDIEQVSYPSTAHSTFKK